FTPIDWTQPPPNSALGQGSGPNTDPVIALVPSSSSTFRSWVVSPTLVAVQTIVWLGLILTPPVNIWPACAVPASASARDATVADSHCSLLIEVLLVRRGVRGRSACPSSVLEDPGRPLPGGALVSAVGRSKDE